MLDVMYAVWNELVYNASFQNRKTPISYNPVEHTYTFLFEMTKSKSLQRQLFFYAEL